MANQFSVQPASVMPGLSAAMAGIRSGAESKREAVSEQAKQVKLKEASTLMNEGKLDELSTLMVENTWIRDNIDKTMNWKNEQTKQNAIESAKDILIKGVPPAQALNERAKFVAGQGGDASGTIQLAQEAQQDPQTAITEAEKVLALYEPDALKAYRSLQGGGEEDSSVGAREILEDGTIIQSTQSGPVVWSVEGERLTGAAASDAVKAGRAEKVSNLRKAAGEKKKATLEEELALKAKIEAGVISAKDAAKISTEAYSKLNVIDTNIRNLREGIQLVKDGADTGVIASRMPSVRQASIKLDNLQGRLGLDVLHSTTFGALSAAELKFALDTALPKTLEGEDLVNWMEEKISAQEKLSDYVESAAIYLGTPGNTTSGWIEKKRNARLQAKAADTELPSGVTEDDINATMQANSMTREQVLARLSGGQ